MKVLIAGSRGFTDYTLLASKMNTILSESTEEITIISGTAPGADRLGERYAEENGLYLVRMPAEWDKLGKSAGFKRNVAMAEVATHAVIFWDGQSVGTSHMIAQCRKKGIPTRVIDSTQRARALAEHQAELDQALEDIICRCIDGDCHCV